MNSKNETNENELLSNRSEILFLYDVCDANPNGDPLDDNRPRIDEETDINLVTDVRLKRTIRDYLNEKYPSNENKDKEIFIIEKQTDEGKKLLTATQRLNDIIKEIKKDIKEGEISDKKELEKYYNKKINEEILERCIDIRLFGATILSKSNSFKIDDNDIEIDPIILTGPVQFRMGRSLHEVLIKDIKGNTGFASDEGNNQRSFRDDYIVYYSFIAFYGVINQNAAKFSKMKNNDVNVLLEGIWNGNSELITRTKIGHTPRLLLQIEYKEESNAFIGDLNNRVSLDPEEGLDEKKIRNINQFTLVYDKLLESLEDNKNKIKSIKYKIDNSLRTEMKYNYKDENKDDSTLTLIDHLENICDNVIELNDNFKGEE